MVAFGLVIIGGLNWLLHAFDWNVVDLVLGEGSVLSQAVYVLVGLSAVYLVAMHGKDCKVCKAGGSTGMGGQM